MMKRNFTRTILAASLALGVSLAWQTACAANWFPYKAEVTEPAYSADGKKVATDYAPLAKASQKWDICVSFPHMKDAYWLGVDYGVVEEAKRQGVKMNLFEAGGYTNLSTQISQIEDCVARGAKAVVIGGISADGHAAAARSPATATGRTTPPIAGVGVQHSVKV